MDTNNKNQVLSLLLTLNLIIGLYNIFLFCYGNMFLNLVIGSTNIGVWIFFRDKKLIMLLKNQNKNKH